MKKQDAYETVIDYLKRELHKVDIEKETTVPIDLSFMLTKKEDNYTIQFPAILVDGSPVFEGGKKWL